MSVVKSPEKIFQQGERSEPILNVVVRISGRVITFVEQKMHFISELGIFCWIYPKYSPSFYLGITLRAIMDFIDELRQIAARADTLGDSIQTEEATKNALILPFIKSLGYDVFNPLEVCPEFTADVGLKKGEKVDYAILINGQPQILIECKKQGASLATNHINQLFRYFLTTPAKFGILTDGIHYKLFTDLETEHRMDLNPFHEFSLRNIKDQSVKILQKLTRSNFNSDDLFEEAESIYTINTIRNMLIEESNNPTENFIRYCLKPLNLGVVTHKVVDRYQSKVKRALHEFIIACVNEKLELAPSFQNSPPAFETDAEMTSSGQTEVAMEDRPIIITTPEESQAYYLVKSILRKHVNPERVSGRDTLSYFGVLLDDNNRKPICRFWFNRSQWYLGILDSEKNEERIAINSLDDIYHYADRIIQTVQQYEHH